MTLLGFGTLTTAIIQKGSFGALGDNVAMHIRKILYSNILQKDIGWFDHRENSAGVLTSSMATDTAVVNGVSSESISPQIEGGFSFMVGLGMGFYFCWQMALVMIFCAPLLGLGWQMQISFLEGAGHDDNDRLQQANLLCGDAIMNYKTVQSFGYENKVVETYRKLIEPGQKSQLMNQILAGVGYGFS